MVYQNMTGVNEEAEYITSLAMHFSKAMDLENAVFNAFFIRACQNIFGQANLSVNIDRVIRDYVKETYNLKVTSIARLKSISQIPEKIGDTIITEDITSLITNFIQTDRANHYIINTNDSSKIFVLRTNSRDKKVLKAKDIIDTLDIFYNEFFQKTESASNTLKGIDTGLENDMRIYCGKVYQGSIHGFNEGFNNVRIQLNDAKTPLKKLELSTNYFAKRDFKIESGYSLLKDMNSYCDHLEKRLNSLKVFPSYTKFF